ncbi:MAG: TspO/MBR family protein [Novosphingobium sp.]
MNELASVAQLRAGFLRWMLFCVPGVLLLGFLSGRSAGLGPDNPWVGTLLVTAIYPVPVVLGIVWVLLYILMGTGLAVVLAARGAPGRGLAIGAFVVQLLLNLVWGPIISAMHQNAPALGLTVGLGLAVVVTLVAFVRVRPLAGLLLVPYVIWVLGVIVLFWQISDAVTRIEL